MDQNATSWEFGRPLQRHGRVTSSWRAVPSPDAGRLPGSNLPDAGFGPMRQAASALRPEALRGFVAASFTTEARRSLLGGSRGWAKRQRCILEFHALQHLARPGRGGKNADIGILLGL